jgi:hypothetical protein
MRRPPPPPKKIGRLAGLGTRRGAAKAVWLSDSQAAHADAGALGSRERNDLALAALLPPRVRPIAREVK